ANLLGFLERFSDLHVLIIGEAILDTFLEGQVERFCPDAPAPVVSLTGRKDLPGGAANAALNLHKLGAKATFLSVTGPDREGENLRNALQEQGVEIEKIFVEPGRATLAKQRVLAGGQLLFRLDQGSTEPISKDSEAALIDCLAELFPQCHGV